MQDRLYIPEFFQEEVEFSEASKYFTYWWNRPGKSDRLLDKLIDFENWYVQTIRQIDGNVHDRYKDTDTFFEEWRWEILYFNKLFEGFAELLASKKEVA